VTGRAAPGINSWNRPVDGDLYTRSNWELNRQVPGNELTAAVSPVIRVFQRSAATQRAALPQLPQRSAMLLPFVERNRSSDLVQLPPSLRKAQKSFLFACGAPQEAASAVAASVVQSINQSIIYLLTSRHISMKQYDI